MNRALAVVGGLIGLLLIGYALLSGKTDEELIVERLEALSDAVRVDEDTSTNPILRVGAVRGKFEEIFTEDVRFRIPELSGESSGRDALGGLATRASSYLKELDVAFGSTEVDVVDGSKTARVETIATVTGVRRSGRVERDDRAVHFDFVKTSDGWRIDEFSVEPKSSD